VGTTQADINYEYKEVLAKATAWEHAERIISRMVVKDADVTEEKAKDIYQRELQRISRKFTHMRYHSFLVYFGVLKRLNWVEVTGGTETSSIQANYPRQHRTESIIGLPRKEKTPARNSCLILSLRYTRKSGPAT